MASGRQVKCAVGVGGDGDRAGGERVGCPFDSCVSYIVWCLTPDDKVGWCVRRGRQVKCAAGGGGDGDRAGGEWVGCALGMQRPEFIKSGLAGLTAGYDILRNVVRRNETAGRTH